LLQFLRASKKKRKEEQCKKLERAKGALYLKAKTLPRVNRDAIIALARLNAFNIFATGSTYLAFQTLA